MKAVFSFVFEKSEFHLLLKNSAQSQTLILSSVIPLLNTTYFLNLLLFEMFENSSDRVRKTQFYKSFIRIWYRQFFLWSVVSLRNFYARYCFLWKSNTICKNQIVPIAYKQVHVSRRFQVLTPVISLQVNHNPNDTLLLETLFFGRVRQSCWRAPSCETGKPGFAWWLWRRNCGKWKQVPSTIFFHFPLRNDGKIALETNSVLKVTRFDSN